MLDISVDGLSSRKFGPEMVDVFIDHQLGAGGSLNFTMINEDHFVDAESMNNFSRMLRSLLEYQQIDMVRVHDCRFGIDAFSELLGVLQHFPALKRFDFCFGSLPLASESALCGLPRLSNLVEIHLFGANVGDKYVRGVCCNLKSCSIRRINLGHNEITRKSVPHLVVLFTHCNNLLRLDLSFNRLGNVGIKAMLLGLRKVDRHFTLDVSHNRQTNISIKYVREFYESSSLVPLVRCNAVSINLEETGRLYASYMLNVSLYILFKQIITGEAHTEFEEGRYIREYLDDKPGLWAFFVARFSLKVDSIFGFLKSEPYLASRFGAVGKGYRKRRITRLYSRS